MKSFEQSRIEWSSSGKSWIGTSWIAALLAAAAASLISGTAQAGEPTGDLVLTVARVDDRLYPDDAFFGEFTVTLDPSNPPSVKESGVSVTIWKDSVPGEPIPLERDENPALVKWSVEKEWPSLAAMTAELEGTWILTLELTAGPPHSVSQFTFTAGDLTEGNFWPSPTITDPTHLEAGVAPGVTLTWNDPTGEDVPHALSVEVENNTRNDPGGDRDEFSLQPDSTAWTTWDPPSDVLPGFNEFAVAYFGAAGSDTYVSAVSVSSGPIVWVKSPLAPESYPSNKPLLALGSESIIDLVPQK